MSHLGAKPAVAVNGNDRRQWVGSLRWRAAVRKTQSGLPSSIVVDGRRQVPDPIRYGGPRISDNATILTRLGLSRYPCHWLLSITASMEGAGLPALVANCLSLLRVR